MKKVMLGVLLILFALSLIQSPRVLASPELPADIEETKSGVEAYRGQGQHENKVHLWGYGELQYDGPLGTGQKKTVNMHRFVIGLGYDFTDKINMRSEIDAEDAFKEPELEFAYLDFMVSPALNVRVGSLLMPIGVINENHEPPTFNGTQRPEIYVNLIPTSWQEGGAGFYGELADGLTYQIYGVQALSAVGAGTNPHFTADSGIREGRGHAAEAAARDFAGVARVSFTGIPNFRVGASGYAGNSSQGLMTFGGRVVLGEGDARYSIAGFDIEGLASIINIQDAAQINAANGLVGNASIGSTLLGAYGEIGYHLLPLIVPSSDQDVVLFSRYEWYDTQYRVPAGFTADGDNRRKNIWLGVTYRPIPQVAAKANYIIRDDANGGRADKIEVGVGYYF